LFTTASDQRKLDRLNEAVDDLELARNTVQFAYDNASLGSPERTRLWRKLSNLTRSLSKARERRARFQPQQTRTQIPVR
jgi:hypothetical protein